MTKSCDHNNYSTQSVEEVLFDSTFSVDTDVCDDCGAFFSDSSYRFKRNKWLAGLYKEDKEKFSIHRQAPEQIV